MTRMIAGQAEAPEKLATQVLERKARIILPLQLNTSVVFSPQAETTSQLRRWSGSVQLCRSSA